MTLLPSLFVRYASTPITPQEPPLLMYAARGIGTLWESERTTAPAALEAVLGGVRAGLLNLLASPASSTELALRLGVSPSAVNQHLRPLRDAGLLISARHGRSMLYLRSALGDQLVAGRAGLPAGGPETRLSAGGAARENQRRDGSAASTGRVRAPRARRS
ncbi:ArsR/SmtB family transcription factor [Jatrophihabitans sp. GAS493]|uniref:ArsR/SmtB family transcription factor n=1 Tax=Jatrophihabitans sp. GAS493 TaxID=1907575 RepID=UPI00352B9D85